MKQKLDFFIIDDSETTIFYIEDLIREFEFTGTVTTFLNAKEALNEFLDRFNNNLKLPDIILLDVRMPEMDGFEFLEELEQDIDDELDTKVFILTSSNHKRDIESYNKQFIASEFINKPIDKDFLESKINKYFS